MCTQDIADLVMLWGNYEGIYQQKKFNEFCDKVVCVPLSPEIEILGIILIGM